jgi:hypothetical protein
VVGQACTRRPNGRLLRPLLTWRLRRHAPRAVPQAWVETSCAMESAGEVCGAVAVLCLVESKGETGEASSEARRLDGERRPRERSERGLGSAKRCRRPKGAVSRLREARRRKQRGSLRLPQAVGAVRRRPRGTAGPSARSRGAAARGHRNEARSAASTSEARPSGAPRGRAASSASREPRGRPGGGRGQSERRASRAASRATVAGRGLRGWCRGGGRGLRGWVAASNLTIHLRYRECGSPAMDWEGGERWRGTTDGQQVDGIRAWGLGSGAGRCSWGTTPTSVDAWKHGNAVGGHGRHR